jgi:hypothetical protein
VLWANDADAGVLTASAAYSTLPVTYLQTPQLDQRWRTNDGAASAWVVADLGSSLPVDLVGLLATNLGAAATARVRVSTADATGAAGNAYDSTTFSPDLSPSYPHLVRALTAPVTGRYVRIDVADAGLTLFEAGRLVIGSMFRPAINFRTGYGLTVKDGSRVDESEGGQEWVERRVARRGVTLRFPAISAAEQRQHATPMQLQRGIAQDIGILLDTASAVPGEDFIWGLPQALAPVRNVFFQRFDMEISVVERAWF